ncbi:MAG: response regulator [Deltaproteobacteria bacterium]|nr:response regulator [Deltaproteobacteria bacterium]
MQSGLFAVIINDDSIQLKLISSILKKAGFKTAEFSMGSDALDFLKENTPDLIITDLYMPEIDGWQICRQIKTSVYHHLHKTPVCITSATFSGMDSYTNHPGIPGADLFISFPINSREMIKKINSLMINHSDNGQTIDILLGISDEDVLHDLSHSISFGNLKAHSFQDVNEFYGEIQTGKYSLIIADHTILMSNNTSSDFDKTPVLGILNWYDGEKVKDFWNKGITNFAVHPFDKNYIKQLCLFLLQKKDSLDLEKLLDSRTRELSISTSILSEIQNVAHIGNWKFNSKSHNLFWSEEVYRIFGIRNDETLITYSKLLSLIHPEDLESFKHLCSESTYLKGVSNEFEHRIVRENDGEIRTVIEKFFNESANDGSVDTVGIVYDITEKRTVENELTRSISTLNENAQVMKIVLDTTDIHVAFLDTDFNFIWVNRIYAEKNNSDPQYFQGKNHFELFPDEENIKIFKSVIDTGKPYIANARKFILKQNETEITSWWDWSLIPVRTDESITGLVLSLREVTSQVLEQQKEKKTSVRQQKENMIIAQIATSDELATGDIKKLAEKITEEVCTKMGVSRVGIWLFTEDETTLKCLDNFSLKAEIHEKDAVLLENDFRNEFSHLKMEKFVDAHDAWADPRTHGYLESYLKPHNIRSMLDTVIRSGGKTLGTICLEYTDKIHHWEEDEISFGCQLADQFALAISNMELQKATERWKEARNMAKIGDWEYSTSTDTLKGSEELFKIIGIPVDIEKNPSFIVPYAEFESSVKNFSNVVPYLKKVSSENGKIDIEFEIINQITGETHFLHTLGKHKEGTDGVSRVITGTIQDITEKKLREKALQESEHKLRSVFDNSVDFLMLLDKEHRITMINRPEEGLKSESLVNKPLFTLVEPKDQQRVKQHLDAALNGEGVQTYETVYQRPSGETVYFSSIASPVIFDGEISGLVISSRDITERINLLEKNKILEKQYFQAQKMEAVGRLAGGVAHDFNNVLCAISGNTSLLLDDISEHHPFRESISEIHDAAKRAGDLTKQLLLFSSRQVIEPTNLNLNSLIKNIIPMLNRLLGEKITLETNFKSSETSISGDIAQMEQILLNLIINARDAMPDGGKIAIETGVEEKQSVVTATGLLPEGLYSVLTVEDTGHGIEREILDKIFDPFFTTKETGKGTGLGLSTVLGIVKQNSAGIDVITKHQLGTKFIIYFPFKSPEISQSRSRTKSSFQKGHETILLVEDEDIVRNVGRRILENYGYRVLEAESGIEAIEISRNYSGKIDLLLTDVVMPDINGKELSEKLYLTRPDMEILFTSGYTQNVIAQHGILEKGINFIPKPYSVETLTVKVRKILDKKQENSE